MARLLLSLLLAGVAPAARTESSLEGDWTEVEIGCGSMLDDSGLAKLPKGGLDIYRHESLRVRNGAYSIQMLPGDSCKPGSRTWDRSFNPNFAAFCGKELRTEGTVAAGRLDGKYIAFFQGEPVVTDGGSLHNLGVEDTRLEFDRRGNILILIYANSSPHCDGVQKFFTYWMPTPSS